MKASVDEELCTGCGLCIETCPEVFDMDDDNVAQVKVETVPADQQDACQQAADDCPVEAITIED